MPGSTDSEKRIQRDVLPIPDKPYTGHMAYDAKDPDSSFPPIGAPIGGGWMLYVKGGKHTYIYSFLGLQKFVVTSTESVPAAKHQPRMEFANDGGGLAKGGSVTLFLEAKPSDKAASTGRFLRYSRPTQC